MKDKAFVLNAQLENPAVQKAQKELLTVLLVYILYLEMQLADLALLDSCAQTLMELE